MLKKRPRLAVLNRKRFKRITFGNFENKENKENKG